MDCSRRQFIATTLGAGALIAIGPGCNNAIAPDGTVTVVGGKATLDFVTFPKLMTVGNGVTVATDGGVPFAVIRTGDTTAIAINAVCTHEGCTAVYRSSLMAIHCDCHGSEYNLTGAVTHGPAEQALSPMYPAVVSDKAITVTISG